MLEFRGPVASSAQPRDRVATLCDEALGEVPADEPRDTRDENAHSNSAARKRVCCLVRLLRNNLLELSECRRSARRNQNAPKLGWIADFRK